MKVVETRKDGTRRVFTRNTQPSMTDQSQASECDVNTIMKKYVQTGEITHLARTQGVYADMTMVTDLQGAFATVDAAHEAFMTLPSALREKLQNDPTKLVDYLNDPNNLEESVTFGLREKKDLPQELPPKEEKNKKAPPVPKED